MTTPPTPKTAAILSAAATLAAVAGCNNIETTTQARLAPEPRGTLVAATTQPTGDVAAGTEVPIRNWNRSVAEYANGDTASDSTGVRYISDVGALFGKGGRTTRSDVVAAGGGPGATGVTPIGGAQASAGGASSTGVPASAGLSSPSVAGGVASGTVGPTASATPAIASGSTVNGQVVRGDGSIVPAGSPGAAGTPASIGAAPGSVSASVAPDATTPVDTSSVAPRDTAFTPTEQAVAVAALPFVETGVFFANVVTSPVTFWQQRDGIVSGGLEFPPTHTAMPALPYEPARKAPKAAPPAVAAPAVPLVPTGVYPTTSPAATDVTKVLPSTRPATPLVVPATTRPVSAAPRAATTTRPAAGATR